MSKEQILRHYYNRVIYTRENWSLLESKRNRAKVLLEILVKFDPFVYGSIARGNINKTSDIDIVITQQIPSFQIEFNLNQNGFESYFREIIMATPQDSIKLYIHLSELECITLPLTKLSSKSEEFYKFGGKINLKQLNNNIRVPGIDKRLVYIKPNQLGHEEFSIVDNEAIGVKELGINIQTILERKKVLLRREKHGRTGVFLKRTLDFHESTEAVLKELANKKSIIRKKLFQR
jgi:predicted nucleotidyltransferase